MPYEINSERDGRGVVVTWEGSVSASEILAINRHIYEKDRLRILRYQIWDFSRVTKEEIPDLTLADVRNFAMQDACAVEQNPKLILALVGNWNFFTGFQSIYKIVAGVWADKLKCEVFPAVAAARFWIAREHPELEEICPEKALST
jgi:hypothetical protein